MKNAWKEHGKTTQESASRELSCPQEEEFFQNIRFLLWKPIQKQMQPGLMAGWGKPSVIIWVMP